jgi:hypothetical protein
MSLPPLPLVLKKNRRSKALWGGKKMEKYTKSLFFFFPSNVFWLGFWGLGFFYSSFGKSNLVPFHAYYLSNWKHNQATIRNMPNTTTLDLMASS